MAFTLTPRDLQRLKGAHPDLVRVFKRAAAMSGIPFMIAETLRSLEQQRRNVMSGVSGTLRSRHLAHPKDGLSRAVDVLPLVDGQPTYAWPVYHRLAPIIKEAARLEKVPLEWGGNWRSLKDGPHWQLPWKDYP